MGSQDKRISRRQVLTGTGAAIASVGVVSLGSAEQNESIDWDHETDILVVGSGVGASTAAITAHENGDAVMLIEKAGFPGGTSAKSAGVLWIPNNFTLRKKGINDRKSDCIRYQARFSYPERYNPDDDLLGLNQHEYALLEAFYDNASPAVDSLRKNGSLNVAEYRMAFLDRPATDYLDHVPENKVPTGRPLGPVTAEGTIGLGTELMDQLGKALLKRNIPTLLSHEATDLFLDDKGRVIGIQAGFEDKSVNIKASKAVIFATGGYVHNQEMINNYQPAQLYGSCATPFAEGDFIKIGGKAGAQLGNIGGAWRTQIVFEDTIISRHLNIGVFFPPGDSCFQVNKYGLRAVDENRNYNDRTEVHGLYDASNAEYPNQLMFMVYDHRTALAFAGDYPLPAEPTDADYVMSAGNLEDLTTKIATRLAKIKAHTGGLSLAPEFESNLKRTVKRYNKFAETGIDEDFQRGKSGYDREWFQLFSPPAADSGVPANDKPSITMFPLSDKGPYYAIILAAGALDTCGGPVIDSAARVLDTRDAPIPGLYGAGNCIASPSKEAYYGAGHTLGMSMTFGFIAANSAHKETKS